MKQLNKRTIFTPEMLVKYNFGLFIVKNTNESIFKRPSYFATISFKLIWSLESTIKKYGRCNFLTDGWFFPMADTKEELCKLLNEDPVGFRIMKKWEVLYIIFKRKQGFR